MSRTDSPMPAAPSPQVLRATTRTLTESVDLNDVAGGDGFLFVREGIGVAGRGVACRIRAEGAEEFLGSIPHVDTSGLNVAPIALGVLPFDPSRSTELIVPQLIVGKRADGGAWVTTFGDADTRVSLALPPLPTAATYEVTQISPVSAYLDAVVEARDAVRRGEITKAVIARAINVSSSEPIDVHAVLLRLKASFSQSYRYSIDGFIGASPELLLSIDGDTVRSHPLAGTTARTGDPATDDRLAAALVASMKDQIEHRVVIDVIHDQLLPWCSYLDWQAEPSVLKVANVQHLGTSIEGKLSDSHPPLMTLVRSLSPTPALGGHPREAALQLVARLESVPRGRYGGAVGWVDGHGNGTWAVAIRCAELSDDRRSAVLKAGGGIVAESDPDAELAETQAKFQAMLSAIIRP